MHCHPCTQILTSGLCLLCCKREDPDLEAANNAVIPPNKEEEDHIPMMMPGVILHVEKLNNEEEDAMFCVSEKSQSYFADIVVSPHMISDHKPYNLTDALHAIVEGAGRGSPKNIV